MMKGRHIVFLFLLSCSNFIQLLAIDYPEELSWYSSENPKTFLDPKDPKIKKCIGDLAGKDICIQDLIKAFFTQKLALGKECCAALKAIGDDCIPPIFAVFGTPFYNIVLNKFCPDDDNPGEPGGGGDGGPGGGGDGGGGGEGPPPDVPAFYA